MKTCDSDETVMDIGLGAVTDCLERDVCGSGQSRGRPENGPPQRIWPTPRVLVVSFGLCGVGASAKSWHGLLVMRRW